LWLTANKSLPTNQFHLKHHLFAVSVCNRCGAPQQSIIHLHDYNKAQRIWNLLQLDVNQQAFNQDSTSWIRHYARKRSKLGTFIIRNVEKKNITHELANIYCLKSYKKV